MSPPPSDPSDPTSFPVFVDYTLTHTFLPLVFKRVFDECGSNAFESSHLIPDISQAENDTALVQEYAETYGCGAAEQRWTSTDVLMSALVDAVSRKSTDDHNDCALLQETMDVGRKTFGKTSTDPKFVGATENHRKEEVNETHQTPPVASIRRPNSTRQKADVMQRSDPIQPLSGIAKPAVFRRRPLSEKARTTLENWFQDHIENPYPDNEEKERLANLCGVSMTSVNTWFGNKRMRIKRKMLQVDSQGVEDITNRVLAPKTKWGAVVLSRLDSEAGQEVLANVTKPTETGQEKVTSEGQPKRAWERLERSDLEGRKHTR